MTKTQILKFCGDSIYPNAYKASDRNTPDVYRTIINNVNNTNRNQVFFYTRNRGINCIAMKMLQLITNKNLACIENGVISYKNIIYIDKEYDDKRHLKIFLLHDGNREDSKSVINAYDYTGLIVYKIQDLLTSIINDDYLILSFFNEIEDVDIRARHSCSVSYDVIKDYIDTNNTIVFCVKLPFTYNDVTVTSKDAKELSEQSIARRSSFITNGGLSKLETMQNFSEVFEGYCQYINKVLITYIRQREEYNDSL